MRSGATAWRAASTIGWALLCALACDDGADTEPGPNDGGRDAESADAAHLDAARDAVSDGDPALDVAAPDVRDAAPDTAPHPDASPIPDAAVDLPDLGPPDAAPDLAPPDAGPPEVCGGGDEDGDGRVDEGAVCAAYAATRCRAWLGVADGPAPAGPTFADCPAREQDWDGPERCISSRGDGLFHALPLAADLDAGDTLAVALTCPDDPVGAWIQAHCRLGLTVRSKPAAALDGTLDDCEACVVSGVGFTTLTLDQDVDADDSLGVAFRCAADDDPERAGAINAGLDLWLFHHFREEVDGVCINEDFFDAVEGFGACPLDRQDNEGRHRCAASGGDGRFRGFGVAENTPELRDVTRCSALGLALRLR